jgi:hypothetical protein
MIERGPATEEEVILAYLRAEIDSCRFAQVRIQVSKLGRTRGELIDEVDLTNQQDNKDRLLILQQSGRPFCWKLVWRRTELEPSDLGRLRYYPGGELWKTVSDGTMQPCLVALKMACGTPLPDDPACHIEAIQKRLKCGLTFPKLIAEERDDLILIIEGHCRATAYIALGWNKNIGIFLGRREAHPR